jgi:hemolysin D
MARSRDACAFLPAVLEVQRTPPLPASRAILWTVMALFACVLVWAAVGRVDVVAVAPGRIVPLGRVKTVQPLESGVVSAIHVREGQRVAAGDLLIELDAEKTRADLLRLRLARDATAAELRSLELQLRAFVAFPAAANYFERSAGHPLDAAIAATPMPIRRRIDSRLDEHYAERAALEDAAVENRAERLGSERRLALLDATLPLLTERAQAMQQLEARSLASRASWYELEIPRLERDRERGILGARLAALDAAQSRLQRRLRALVAGERSRMLEARAELVTELSALDLDIGKAELQVRERRLTAPEAATVHQLSVHTIGGVVTPAQQLMLLVPHGGVLAVEAFVANRDVGFVRTGQRAEIKIETFPFTQYGTIDGTVTSLSHDAIADEQAGLVYLAEVSLERSTITTADRVTALAPGMSVTVEIKLGRRRLIEFLAAPLLRYRAEGFRER